MIESIGKHLAANPVPTAGTRKTREWLIEWKPNGRMLGSVQWFGRLRQYTFDPCQGTTFKREWLLDIAAFLDRATREHRAENAGS